MSNGQSIQALMANLQRDDWGGIEKLMGRFAADPQAKERSAQEERAAHERRARYLAALAAVFSTEDGRLVLEELLNGTLRRTTFQTQFGVDPLQAYAHGAFREGQNAVVATILKDLAEVGRDHTPEKELSDERWGEQLAAGTDRIRHRKPSGWRNWRNWRFWRR
ncbi:hypothetical protein PUV47_01980 [Pseudovibrio exalbescens]|uniref:Bbp19 family protein n=1 Tax=Pseudovibrio exalbescens TaxID=197461 RepID=UPI002366C643|nr:hypothetical protein [Pseudovibrio exalbescens]MDD7908673.1 hypothetical protein [Pseudovibrio exalbescens]